MLSSYAPSAPAVSTHFVGESTRAVCFLKDVARGGGGEGDASSSTSLPLIAVGGDSALALYLPEVTSSDEAALRQELANGSSIAATKNVQLRAVAETPHDGDVTALRFAGGHANLLLTASSTGSIHALRVGGNDQFLTPVLTPHWSNLFGERASVTALDVWSDRATLVAASSSGAVAWLRFDDMATVPQVVRNGDSSRLPISGVKMLARESVAATVGAAPGAQLRVWDINANPDCPVAAASDPQATCMLTALETHPTRPELLVTGSDDGRVALWDLRRLDAPFRVETKHQRAVRTLAIHRTSPRLLFSGGDDATVLAWDFHHNRSASETVEYEKHAHHKALAVQPLASAFLPWRAMDFHAASDSLVVGSDAQSLLLVRYASRAHHAIA